MKPLVASNLLLVCLLTLSANVSEAARAPLLRHSPLEGQTNLYRVEISVHGESGTDLLAGNVFVSAKQAPSNVVTLNLQGTLTPRRETSARPTMPSPYHPRWTTPITLRDCEVQFDERGRLLSVAGDSPLPCPLGTVARLFFETFPERAGARWETTAELSVIGETLTLGPATSFVSTPGMYPSYSYYPTVPGSRGGLSAVNVSSRTKYEITSIKPDRVIIAKRIAVESYLLTRQEPQILATGAGQFEIAPASGLLLSAELESNSATTTETITRRTTTSLKVKLLEGEEREAALRPSVQAKPSLTAPKPLTKDELNEILEELQSSDNKKRYEAANKLQTMNIDEAPDSLVEFMSGKLEEADSSLQNIAVKIIADHGTKEHVPLLLSLLRSDNAGNRQAALRGLGRLGEPSAAEPIADVVAAGGYEASTASEALIKIGAAAEDAALSLLRERHNETRRTGCKILKQIGGEKSLKALQELVLVNDRQMSEAAAEAARAINARLQSK